MITLGRAYFGWCHQAHVINTVLYTIEIDPFGGCGTHALPLNEESNTGATGT